MQESITTANSCKWDLIWSERETRNSDWDYLSEVVFQVLKEEIGEFKNKRIIEIGSGSGRISMKIRELFANVTLLDYSPKALDMSRNLFYTRGVAATFIQADILEMPLEDSCYDVAWNAGVLEHFSYEKQREVIKRMAGAIKNDGIVITLNPYSRSILYKLGKGLLIAFHRWAFGREYPIHSIRDIFDDIDKDFDLKEYSMGFIVFFVDIYKFLPKKIQHSKIIKKISKLFIRFAEPLSGLDKFLSRIFGGYLIVSVIKNK